MTNEQPTCPLAGRSVSDEYHKWVKSRMPRTAALLDILDSGTTPNFLDIMGGLSDLVAFYTECDSIPNQLIEEKYFMSGKFCRFCS